MKYKVLILGLLASACGDGASAPQSPTTVYRPHHAQTMRFGTTDNAEVVKVLPDSRRAIVVASKARKVTLIAVQEESLSELESKTLFQQDTSESELTHIDFAPDGSWAVLTRTQLSKDADGGTTGCSGSLVFIDAREGPSFGQVLKEVSVGPMPDAVDVSPDGKWVVSANERDVVWGKCEGVDGLEGPSISVLDVSNGPEAAVEVHRLVMSENLEREPEQVVFAKDSDLIVATLQDSHEVLFVRRSALVGTASASEALGSIVALPKNGIGQDAWPDGLASVLDANGQEVFVVAGEANDTLTLLDAAGTLLTTIDILATDIPADFPRDGSWGPLFRPDSVTAYRYQGLSYVAATLKAAGAVGIWDISDPKNPQRVVVEKIGAQEMAGAEEESSLGTEGISASPEHGFIITANEGESSVSLLVP